VNIGTAAELDALGVVVVAVFDDAALAIAEPPTASAATAATPISTFLSLWNIRSVLSVVPGLPRFTDKVAARCGNRFGRTWECAES
jgi:hypothetical protein